jgi:hypothetical protein
LKQSAIRLLGHRTRPNIAPPKQMMIEAERPVSAFEIVFFVWETAEGGGAPGERRFYNVQTSLQGESSPFSREGRTADSCKILPVTRL